MSMNYSSVRAHLLNAFLALDGDRPEDERLRRGIEQVLEAVARAERTGSPSLRRHDPVEIKRLNCAHDASIVIVSKNETCLDESQ